MIKRNNKGNWLKKVSKEIIYLDIETEGKATSLIITICCLLLATLLAILCLIW